MSRPDLMQKASVYAQEEMNKPGMTYYQAALNVENRIRYECPEIESLPRNNPIPTQATNKSNYNKSESVTNITSEAKQFKSLSSEQQTEYEYIKSLVERHPGIKYSVNDYLNANNKGSGLK